MYANSHTGTSVSVYETLKDQILHLDLLPGSSVSEIDTAEKYETSRTPVRDAFKLLERDGLLEIQPHIGTFVSLIDLQVVSNILYMREKLEQAVYKELATSHDRSQDFRVRMILQQQRDMMDQALPNEELSRAFTTSDNAFHRTLYDLAGKSAVMDFISSIQSQYERFRTFLKFNDREYLLRLCNDHRHIWEAIIAQDYENLAGLISHHIYDGFNSNADAVVRQHPEYFKSPPV